MNKNTCEIFEERVVTVREGIDKELFIDDTYLKDVSACTHLVITKKQNSRIERAGMRTAEKRIPGEQIKGHEPYEQGFNFIKLRCNELIENYSEKPFVPGLYPEAK